MKRFILIAQTIGCFFGSYCLYVLGIHPDKLIDGNADSYLFTCVFFLLIGFFFLSILIATRSKKHLQ